MDVYFASALVLGLGTYISYQLYKETKGVEMIEPLQLPSPIFKGVNASADYIEELEEPSLKEQEQQEEAVVPPPEEAEAVPEETEAVPEEAVADSVATTFANRYTNPYDAEIVIHSRPLVRTTDSVLFEAEIVRGLRKHADTPRIIRTVLEAHGYSPMTLEHLIDAIISSDVLRPAVPLRKSQKAEGIKGIRHELIWHLQRMSRLRAVSLDGM
jgi:hypothetical protein